MSVVVGIQARMSSKRLPAKVLMDLCGAPMVQRVWDACGGYFQRILLTSKDPTDDALDAYAESQGWLCMRGSLEDVLSRYVRACRVMKPSVLVRVCADAPFLQSRWLWRAIEEVEKTDEPVFVPQALHAGTMEHWLLADERTDKSDREHAGAAWFEINGRTLDLVPPGYRMVNTQEDLDWAREQWAKK